MTSLDPLLGRKHLGREYNCLHFADEAWRLLTGETLRDRLTPDMRTARNFTRLREPETPCLVVMKRPGSETHMGVYLRGRVAHLTDKGVRLDEPAIASIGYTHTRFYR